jgi:hypothetical protein
MGPQRTQLSLHFTHPTRDLAIVCQTLGLRPKVIWKKGDERRTPNGRSIGGMRDSSYCSINLGAASKLGLSKKAQAAVKLLKPHRRLLRRLVSEGGRVSFYVGWFCDEHTGEAVDHEVLARMADLSIALDLNIYVPDRRMRLTRRMG